MTISYKDYLKHRKASMPHYTNTALNAFRYAKADTKLKHFMATIGAGKYIGESHSFKESGYTITFKVEPDYDNSYMVEDILPRKDGKNSQGYYVYGVSRYEEKQNPRYKAGEGLTLFLDIGSHRDCYWKRFELPETYIRQFYDNKNYSKSNAYDNMVASAKLAVEQDIKNATGDMYTIWVTVTDIHGVEIFSDCLGGCDDEYATSGQAFLDHDFLGSAQEAILKDLIAFADELI